MPENRKALHFIQGCLLGGAVGDAMGAPVEFDSLDRILVKYDEGGIDGYSPAYGRKGAITDDTQMTLFTAEGMILWRARGGTAARMEDLPVFLYQAYLRWLSTQQRGARDDLLRRHGSCAMIDGVLITRPELFSRRAPGNSCLSALASGRMGTMQEPINNSKGCGGVMRAAPAGYLAPAEAAFETGCALAAVTHGHPSGYLAAGCLALIVHLLAEGFDLMDAIVRSMATLETRADHHECLAAMETAVAAVSEMPHDFNTVESLGQGWIAEEALGISLFCAMAAGDDFEKGLRLAVNHGGDSDSTGAITGNLLGAILGADAVPERFLADLELRDLIEEIAGDLHRYFCDPQVS